MALQRTAQRRGARVDCAIIVCEANEEICPRLYPFCYRVLHWPIEDPVAILGLDGNSLRDSGKSATNSFNGFAINLAMTRSVNAAMSRVRRAQMWSWRGHSLRHLALPGKSVFDGDNRAHIDVVPRHESSTNRMTVVAQSACDRY